MDYCDGDIIIQLGKQVDHCELRDIIIQLNK